MDVDVLIECDICNQEVNIELYDEKLNMCNICKCSTCLTGVRLSDEFTGPVLVGSLPVLSIDIGIQHLGMVLTYLNQEYEFKEIVWMELIDITVFSCDKECKLYHEKTFVDWIAHVVHKYYNIFQSASVILIERQPPQGLVVIEQILFGCFREKSILISPNSIHKFFDIGNLDYDTRKIAVVNLTRKYIQPQLQLQLEKYDRKHDICDAILFTIFWSKKQRESLEIENLLQKRKNAASKFNHRIGSSLNDFFDIYRYIPVGKETDECYK
jgi:hypothetical protein